MKYKIFLILLALTVIHINCGARSVEQDEDWALPQENHSFNFPKDNGSHPKFKIEWWYITGHLQDDKSNPFGFQATFFRVAGPLGVSESNQAFGHTQIFLAHMALTDIKGSTFINEERLNRNGWDAYSSEEFLNIKNGNWSLIQPELERSSFNLTGSIHADASFKLSLNSLKPVVIFGKNSVSKKGSSERAASYYLTYSKLAAVGTLDYKGKHLSVSGQAWMDHEISSSQLSEDLVGWDWTCIQCDDSEYELMLYRLRRSDGKSDPHSQLQWVNKEGKPITEPFKWTVLSEWHSTQSNTTYPACISLETINPKTNLWVKFILTPALAEQELITHLGGNTYWEGSCSVLNDANQKIGEAYLELTGYTSPMKL